MARVLYACDFLCALSHSAPPPFEIAPPPSGAIHKAAETNNVKMLARLLQLGFSTEQPNKFGETAVVIAALHEGTESVMFLADKGANM